MYLDSSAFNSCLSRVAHIIAHICIPLETSRTCPGCQLAEHFSVFFKDEAYAHLDNI